MPKGKKPSDAVQAESSNGKPRLVSKKDLRGTAAAIERRQAAREFNALRRAGQLGRMGDARTQQSLERMMEELKAGKDTKGHDLRYAEVLAHASKLLEHGVSLAELRESVGDQYHLTSDPKRPPAPVLARARRIHSANADRFDVNSWKLFNIDPALMVAS